VLVVLPNDQIVMLRAISAGAAIETDLLEQFDDLHVLRQLCAEGYVIKREHKPKAAKAIPANQYFELTGAGKTELRRGRLVDAG
jgi:hypothetical protein